MASGVGNRRPCCAVCSDQPALAGRLSGDDAGKRSRPSATARQVEREAWRSAGAFARMSRQKYRFDEDRTLRADSFPEACVGWPYSGLTAAPPTGRLPDEAVLERPGYPPRSSTPAGEPSGGPRSRSGLPVCTARSRSIRSRRRFGSPAERASPATGRGESRTRPSSGGLGTLCFLEDELNQRVGGAGYAGNRRIANTAPSSPT